MPSRSNRGTQPRITARTEGQDATSFPGQDRGDGFYKHIAAVVAPRDVSHVGIAPGHGQAGASIGSLSPHTIVALDPMLLVLSYRQVVVAVFTPGLALLLAIAWQNRNYWRAR